MTFARLTALRCMALFLVAKLFPHPRKRKIAMSGSSSTVFTWTATFGSTAREKKLDRDKSLHVACSVPYAVGTLRAVAKKDGKEVVGDEVRTAGKPKRLSSHSKRKIIVSTIFEIS